MTNCIMQIKSIKITNFRSWQDYNLEFNDTTILIGSNGVGKTNILEAVWFLCSGRSWRVKEDRELVNWENEYARISAELINSHNNIEIYLPKNNELEKKQLKIDGVKHRFIDLLGVMPAVLFSPETISLVDGAPGLRRKFLDIVLSQIDRKYAVTLLEYNKVLRERNKLLYNIKQKKSKADELDFWDEKLVELGSFLMQNRSKMLKEFNKDIAKAYDDIAGSDEKMQIKYHPAVEIEHFMDILVVSQESEIAQGATTHGPHRDDFRLYLNGKDIATFGSRGEYRSAVLALKILELKYLEKEKGEKPILLLDDIFSELDSERRMHLAKIVTGQQTIITTTDLDHIEKKLREKAKIVEIV